MTGWDFGSDDPAPMADTGSQASPSKDEDRVPLLDVLHDLGSTLTQSELPIPSQLQHVVGAIVKVMDHAGVEVDDSLYPPEPVAVQRPETADAVHRQKTNDRLERVETLLSQLFDHVKGESSSSGSGEDAS